MVHLQIWEAVITIKDGDTVSLQVIYFCLLRYTKLYVPYTKMNVHLDIFIKIQL